jgi:hypothetical protein
MSFLSLLVLFITVISLTNIEGNPKQQIHVQPNGVITNLLPTMKPDNRRSLIPVPPSNPIPQEPPDNPEPRVPPKTPLEQRAPPQ